MDPRPGRVRAVLLNPRPLASLLRRAREGYEARSKLERIGALFGGALDGFARVRSSAEYPGAVKTRGGCDYDPGAMRAWQLRMARKTRLQYLGTYHTHVEVAGRISFGRSQEDREAFLQDGEASIDLLIGVFAARDRRKIPAVQYLPMRLAYFEPETGYRYIVGAWVKRGKSDVQVPIYLRP